MTLLLSTTLSTTPPQADLEGAGLFMICLILGFGALLFDMVFRARGG